MTEPPVTPDGHDLVIRGRPWRRSGPRLASERHQALVDELVAAQRPVGRALPNDVASRTMARAAIDARKVALGARGPVWWTAGAFDLTRRMACTTGGAEWYAGAALAL